MQEEYGLKVKVYTCDFWVAVLDGLTLKSAGMVKKQAVKSDMESLLAYQRDDTEDVEDEKAKAVAAAKAMKPARKFAKSSTDKKIAGVCGGIAEWLGVNSTIVRIVALLTCGFYFWGYIILWLAMPRSSSTETSA
jgi:phage shock protein PspC (stress-responsive transcriptional regulator)